jgi:integrase
MPKRRDTFAADRTGERFQIGEYYLDAPYPTRGGIWYACRYDAGARTVRRRSLGTSDVEAAKIALATLVSSAPQGTRQGPPGPGEVLTLAVLKAYMDEHAAGIASEDVAARAVELFTAHLQSIGSIEAPVSHWTPSRQLECARWLHAKFDHSAGGIARLFNVMRSAFIDACEVRMRTDPIGSPVEAALISSAPAIVMRQDRVAKELKIPVRPPRRKTLSLDQMAMVMGAIETPHLFRFAMFELCTWARPQAVIDFDPEHQIDWTGAVLDLAPHGWRPTNKRRPCQPLTQCLADWLRVWAREDADAHGADIEAGRTPVPKALLTYKRKRVATTKRAWRRIGRELGIPGFSQYSFRHFMADQTKMLFRGVDRELRSRWLGHVVRDGSRTTDNYEGDDPAALADVALAVDCIIKLIEERCARSLFAVEVQLNKADLLEIGARVLPKTAGKPRKGGGRDRDRTCDPLHVKEVLSR